VQQGLTLNLRQGFLQKLLPESWLLEFCGDVCLDSLDKGSLLSLSLLLFVSDPRI